MPIPLSDLVRMITPRRVNLVLGAGSSMPSGGMSGLQLASKLCVDLGGSDEVSGNLDEVSSILCMKYGRPAVIAKVRNYLESLEPTGGLLALPNFPWPAIYTTNYDTLLELSYKKQRKNLTTVRSNYDWHLVENSSTTLLFKVHGCISQDEVDGHKSRMILTEEDYDVAKKYRESLYQRFMLDLTTKDVLVIGHSLADPDLKTLFASALQVQRESGGTGRLFALIYTPDNDRAALLESRGFRISFGSLDAFVDALVNTTPAPPEQFRLDLTTHLSTGLLPTTVSVAHALSLGANATKLFNGSPAQYADIKAGLTFERSQEAIIFNSYSDSRFVTILLGVAGVGKTTMARRFLLRMHEAGHQAWEHNTEFALNPQAWARVEAQLAAEGKVGYLLIDNSIEFQRQCDILIDLLAKRPIPALKLLLTSPKSHWQLRTKTPNIFARGSLVEVSQLDGNELSRLIQLIDSNSQIASLVNSRFSQLGRLDRLDHLRRRCSADMFVCLKNIFAFERLDTIILQEFADLRESPQDIYRHVAALQAAGAKVHRQLIVRLLGLSPAAVLSLLHELDGIIDEDTISSAEGLYSWHTRHFVIASTIAGYKFSDQTELVNLFSRVIDNLNPGILIELRALREICHADFGIDRITSWEDRIRLYRKIIELAPGERVPHHRLISTYLRAEKVEEADQAIRDAASSVGVDSPINRYRVRAALLRAEKTVGIRDEDRLAMLHQAESMAHSGIRRFARDKYAYLTYCLVGSKILDFSGDDSTLRTALETTREATGRILDPELDKMIAQYDSDLRRQRRPQGT